MATSILRRGSKVWWLALILVLALAPLGYVGPAHAAEGPGALPNPVLPDASGEIAGTVFFDANGNGIQDAGEGGVEGAQVAINGAGVSASQMTDAAGAFRFSGLPTGSYTVSQTNLPGYVSITPDVLGVVVNADQVTVVNFGDAVAMTVRGTVFTDLDGDGQLGLFNGTLEPVVAEALVRVYADLNANGLRDDGEPELGWAASDEQGNYVIRGLKPGRKVVHVTPPAGSSLGSTQEPLELISGEGGGLTRILDLGLPPVSSQPVSVGGVVWNDKNGDELVDDGEPPMPGVRLALYSDLDGNGKLDLADPPAAAKVQSAADGSYKWEGLAPGSYIILVDPATLPAGWLPTFAPEALAFTLAGGQAKTINLGFFDPLAVAPMRVGEWKKELLQNGKPNYTAAQVAQLVAAAEAGSIVYPEAGVSLADALLKPANSPEERARKENAALRLNLASKRLLPKTPFKLPELTTATTVGAAAAQVEGLLYPPAAQTKEQYERARRIAAALNSGQGVGYGMSATATVGRATYDGKDVTAQMRDTGGTVDQYMIAPIRLQKWNVGGLNPDLNALDVRLSLLVQVFYNGGILEVMQVLPDGREVSLGQAVPPLWNKDVKLTYTFNLFNVYTIGDLANVELRIYVRDPDNDGGPAEHVKVDMAQLTFRY